MRNLRRPPPQHIDTSKLKTGVNDVVIPVPSEVFNALDKLGSNPNWGGQLHEKESKVKYMNPPQIAMLLGTIIADGFIAVEAKNVLTKWTRSVAESSSWRRR